MVLFHVKCKTSVHASADQSVVIAVVLVIHTVVVVIAAVDFLVTVVIAVAAVDTVMTDQRVLLIAVEIVKLAEKRHLELTK